MPIKVLRKNDAKYIPKKAKKVFFCKKILLFRKKAVILQPISR